MQCSIFIVLGVLKIFHLVLAEVPNEDLEIGFQSGSSIEAIQQRKPWPTLDGFDLLHDSDHNEDNEEGDDEDAAYVKDEIELDFEDRPAGLISYKNQRRQKILRLPQEILKCGTSPFSPAAISAAMNAGLGIIQQHVSWKNQPREQPHWYNNYEGFHFPDCREGRMFEFPILIGGQIHGGGRTGSRGSPGAHRVIFKADRNGGTFCGLITHEDSERRGSFVACER